MQYHLQFDSSNDTDSITENVVEYKVVVSPGEKISEAVKSFKQLLAEQCGTFKALHSLPHISLATFQIDTEREDLLIKYLDKFTSSLTPFTLSLNDFGFADAVRNDGMAFVSIQNKEAVVQLQTNLHVVLKLDVRVQKKYLVRTAPHITIGRGLNKEKVDKSKEVFADKTYSSDFAVDKLVLLKRNESNLLEVCKEFYFF